MTAVNTSYLQSAIAGALGDFDQAAGPGNINDPLFRLACRLLELAHAAPGDYSEADAEQDASGRAHQLGHDEQSIRDTWKSALRHVGNTAAVIPRPTYQNGNGAHPAGYADLAAYAQAHGVDRAVFAQAGWTDSELYQFSYTDPRTGKDETGTTDQERLIYDRRRRALRFDTDAGPRWRLIDEDKPRPKYWQRPGTHTEATKVWYKLAEALALATQYGVLVLTNGEPSVVVGQHWGVPVLCETGGGERAIPAGLLQLLTLVWPAHQSVIVALDCDGRGVKAAQQKRQQLRDAGYQDVRAVDLALGAGEDLADACRLHQAGTRDYLQACADLPEPGGRQHGQAGQVGAPTTPVGARTQSQAIIDQIAQWGYAIRLNQCADLIEIDGRPMDDIVSATIRTRFRDIGWKRLGSIDDAIVSHAAQHAYHPIHDYLAALPPWDGQGHIAQLASCLHATNPPVAYQDGHVCPLVSVYLHRWLIGAVAKAYTGCQNAMLVFAGPQRLGKSTFARWLCPIPRLFLEQGINTSDKDSHLRLITAWIWEVAELDATTRKADVSALKNFLTQQSVTVRRSYGRFDIHKLPLASLIGTVNDGSGFLMDDTGNRRFFVLDLAHIDRAYQQIDLAQLWAEALSRYRANEPWELLSDEFAVQTDQNRQYLADTPIADWLRKYFFLTGDPNDRMTAGDIIEALQSRGVRLPASDHALSIQLNRAAAMLSLPRERTGRGRFYLGITPKP